MKHKISRRLFSLILVMTMVMGMLPMLSFTVFADWEDGMECWCCGHYHWDEYCCGMCGGCSPECTNTECWYTTHCNECGACSYDDPYWCDECRTCSDCYSSNGWHCPGCYECHTTSEDELCGSCWFCGDCMGGLCDGCGFCEGCWELELMHCEECGNCYGTYEICQYEYLHCEECCIICEQCEECLYEDGIELCDDCGLCVFCCLDNAASEGCSCGEYCVENPDWYDHLCPDCGQAFCEVEMCDLCELCLDCCEGNSDCVESPPVCVEDGDYEFHFCEDCGDCFHNSYICESCEAAGTLLCETCCEIRLEEEGCDCSDRCISDSDIDAHIASAHMNADGSHSATPQNSWEISETHHWRECRFCSESSHITNKAAHVYNNYGVCTICNFDSQKKILILKQPHSVVAKVSDTEIATEEDPLWPAHNLRTFTVAAKGTSALKYQWYVTYGTGQWIALKDDPNETTLISGAKTNTLTVSVSSEGCLYDYAYKCVITDEYGNQVTTNTAYMKVQHVYRKPIVQKGALIGTIQQANKADNIGIYASEGHYLDCVGEGCDADKLVAHSYSKQTRMVKDYYNGIQWIERTCTVCGFKNYIEDHIHYFYDPETYECEIDTTYKNDNQHRLKCLWPGCNKTTVEAHDRMGWQNHGTPYTNANKEGIAYQECQICGYSSSKKLQTYNASQDKMVDAKWTQSTDLVYVENGYSSCDIVVNGTKVIIGFAPSEYSKREHLKMQFPTTTKWTVRYHCDRGSSGSPVDMDVTKYFTFTKIGNELKWSVTIPNFTGRTGGGILTFTPVVEECKHNSGTRIINASKAICTYDGYTGDTVCAGCEGVLSYGEVIESCGKHEGKLTLIPGTAKAGTCETRGYEGTYRCDHCNKNVRGKSTAKSHGKQTVTKNAVAVSCTKFGYSGDVYCECGVLLQEGEILAPQHTDLKLLNEKKATCQQKGYTGDWYCAACDQTVKYGYNVAKADHAWSKWGKINDLYHRHTCVVAGCGAQETSRHVDGNRDLTCDDCGYSWGSDSPVIRSVTFNIDIPVIGQKPDYTKFDGKCYYSDGVGTYKKNGVEWFDVTNNKRFVPGGVNQEFKEGNVYKVTIHFRVKADYEFVEEEAMMATINGREAVVEYVTYGEFVGISYTFEALKHVHSMTRVNKVTPTCTAAGKNTYYYCAACNKYYEDAAAKKQINDLSAWGNVAATGHKASELKSNSTHHFKVCTLCYEEIAGSKAEHSGGTATCLEKAKCTDCGVRYGKVADHSLAQDVWGYIDALGHAHLCTVQGCTFRSEVIPHKSSGAATDDTDEVCLDCGYVITLSANHTHKPLAGYRSDATSHWKLCGCGEHMEKENHTDSNGDRKCDVCEYLLSGDGSGTGGEDATDAGGKKNNGYIIWIIVAVALALGVAGGVTFVIIKKKKEMGQVYEKNDMSTVEPSDEHSAGGAGNGDI